LEIKMLNKYPTLRALIHRIEKHRCKCILWDNGLGEKCFDCHYGFLTKIEEETNLR